MEPVFETLVNLEDYIAVEHQRVESFKAYWLLNHNKNSEQFPIVMELSDWDEALIVFTE